MTKKEKDISKLGEFGLIELLTKGVKLKNDSSIIGIGDDAAVVSYNGKVVITTDMLTEGIHFDLMYTPLKHLGYKAVVVNLSDICAMNATPQQVLVSIAISAKFTTQMMEELYEGIKLACERYQVDLVGGDTTSSLTGLTISITAIGKVDDDKLTTRSGAKPNNLICVSGDLGAAYFGLQLLEREKKIFLGSAGSQPELVGYDYVLERQLKPEARFDIIKNLADEGIKPTSMIDISDGLSSEILHLSKNSGTGCRIYTDKIPVAEETRFVAEEFGIEPVTIALNGGEDYELLFTVALNDYEKLENVRGVTIIGHITEKTEGCYLVNSDNSAIEINALGWDGLNR